MTFLNALQKASNVTHTENGAVTPKSTTSGLLDFFALAGAKRGDTAEAERLFLHAFGEDPQMAVRALFYLRDIRGGQGERAVFRACLGVLRKEVFNQVAHFVPEYGRWDDILDKVDNEVVRDLVAKQLHDDIVNTEHTSLLAKWMPSGNTSSKETRELASKWRKELKLSPREYRKMLSTLRARIKLFEHNMSSKDWESVDYSKIPSQALRKHVKAARRNDEEKFVKFMERVKTGEAKVNTGTLFPYELVMQLTQENQEEIGMLWDNLPDYTNGKNAIVMADTSGSMTMDGGQPMAVALSLALYFAQRNTGAFKDHFMTFSESPQFVHIPPTLTFYEKIRGMNLGIIANTNIQRAFELILHAAVTDSVPQEEMPEILYVISDMEFDSCVSGGSNFAEIKAKFESMGYKLPHVVFWNVNARGTHVPVLKDEGNVSLFSGASASTFKHAVAGLTPYESMLEVLNSERYERIKVEVN